MSQDYQRCVKCGHQRPPSALKPCGINFCCTDSGWCRRAKNADWDEPPLEPWESPSPEELALKLEGAP